MTAVLLPQGKQQYFATAGIPLVGGKVFTYDAGTTNPRLTWSDAGQAAPNANPIILDARGEASVFWAGNYKVQLQDALGNVLWTQDNCNSFIAQSGTILPAADNTYFLGSAILSWANVYVGPDHAPIYDTVSGNLGYYKRTAAEVAAAVTPTNFSYPPGDLRRYGSDPTGGADSSTALQSALSVSAQTSGSVPVFIPVGAFRILTGATVTGQVTVLGQGKNSKLQCDSAVITNHAGNYSQFDNFWMENITAPWIVTRDPTNWGAVIPFGSLVQSNTVLGYQPTVNDPEYATWVANIPAVGTQNIGPVIVCDQAATDITVSRIFGRFFRVSIFDAVNSTICDCEGRGGNGKWGALIFDNWTNSVQRGSNNRILRNRISYASFCGGFFSSNDRFENKFNHFNRNGESGTKTLQTIGNQFTASIGGATSGTVTVAMTNGVYTMQTEDGTIRTATVAGTTAVSWSGALPAGTIQSASFWQSTLNPQCFFGDISENDCDENYYDGVDSNSTVLNTCNAAQTFHKVQNNRIYRNGGDGINADGKYNQYAGNKIIQNYRYGIWGECSHSEASNNDCFDNNQSRSSSQHDLLFAFDFMTVKCNRVWAGTGQNNFGIFLTGANSVALDNTGLNGSTFFFGNPGVAQPVQSNNTDATTGLRTRQSGLFILLDNGAATLQHQFFNDITGSGAAVLSKILGATTAATTTPTGTDASTAFAAGAKISTTSTNGVVFNTAAQWTGDVDFEARVVTNTTGVALNVSVSFQSFSVNGVTLFRPLFRFWNAVTGAAFVLNTTNIGGTANIQVAFSGYLS